MKREDLCTKSNIIDKFAVLYHSIFMYRKYLFNKDVNVLHNIYAIWLEFSMKQL